MPGKGGTAVRSPLASGAKILSKEYLIAKLDRTYRTAANYLQIKSFLLEWADATGTYDYSILLTQPEVMMQMHVMLHRAVQHAKAGASPVSIGSFNGIPIIRAVYSIPLGPSNLINHSTAAPSTSDSTDSPSPATDRSGASSPTISAVCEDVSGASSRCWSSEEEVCFTASEEPVDSNEVLATVASLSSTKGAPAHDCYTVIPTSPTTTTTPPPTSTTTTTTSCRSTRPTSHHSTTLPEIMVTTDAEGMLDGGEGLPGESQRAAAARRLNLQQPQPPSSTAATQHTPLSKLLATWPEPTDSLLRKSLLVLLQAKPHLAKQMSAQTLELLSGLPAERALLVLQQLLLTEGQLQSVGAYVARCARKLEQHFVVRQEQRLQQDSAVWARMAGGEVGQPVPHCLAVWQGPAAVKQLLQAQYEDGSSSPLPQARLRPLHLAALAEMEEAQALAVLAGWLSSPFATSVTLSLKLGCTDAALAARLEA